MKKVLILILSLLSIGSSISQADELDIVDPVGSMANDEIKSLPGLNYTLNFKHYSGYLRADERSKGNLFLHYWFVESQSEPDKDPLVLWLNGGPGCSSMLGLLSELGPYTITPEGEVRENPYSWNKKANVIFLESPAGVGFSFARNGNTKTNDDDTAKQNHIALKSFFKKFPQYNQRPLYLTGESYGGVYLPTLASLVDDDSSMNLKGVAIGNGYLDARKLAESLIFFSYYHGLVGKTTYNGLATYCCNGRPPARGQCNFLTSENELCRHFVNESATEILNEGINPYNLYDKCQGQTTRFRTNSDPSRQNLSREHFDRSLATQFFHPIARKLLTQAQPVGHKFEILHDEPPCTDDSTFINYLNREEVRSAIHIPAELKKPFESCSELDYTMIYPIQKGGLSPFVRKLIKSPRKLNIVVYNGDTDMMCNFLGDEWFVDDLGQKTTRDYSMWKVNGQVAGFLKKFQGITYMTVRGSGHMVPTDRPAEALHLFQNYLLKH